MLVGGLPSSVAAPAMPSASAQPLTAVRAPVTMSGFGPMGSPLSTAAVPPYAAPVCPVPHLPLGGMHGVSGARRAGVGGRLGRADVLQEEDDEEGCDDGLHGGDGETGSVSASMFSQTAGATIMGSARSSRAKARWHRALLAIRFAQSLSLRRDSIGSSASRYHRSGSGASPEVVGIASAAAMAMAMGLGSGHDIGAADSPRSSILPNHPSARVDEEIVAAHLLQQERMQRERMLQSGDSEEPEPLAHPPSPTLRSMPSLPMLSPARLMAALHQQHQQELTLLQPESPSSPPLNISPTRLRGRGTVRALAAAIDSARASSESSVPIADPTPPRAPRATASATPSRHAAIAAAPAFASPPRPSTVGYRGVGAGGIGSSSFLPPLPPFSATPRRLVDYKQSAFGSSGSTLDSSSRSLDILDVAAAAAASGAGGGLYGTPNSKLRAMVSAALAGKAVASAGRGRGGPGGPAALSRAATYGEAVREGIRKFGGGATATEAGVTGLAEEDGHEGHGDAAEAAQASSAAQPTTPGRVRQRPAAAATATPGVPEPDAAAGLGRSPSPRQLTHSATVGAMGSPLAAAGTSARKRRVSPPPPSSRPQPASASIAITADAGSGSSPSRMRSPVHPLTLGGRLDVLSPASARKPDSGTDSEDEGPSLDLGEPQPGDASGKGGDARGSGKGGKGRSAQGRLSNVGNEDSYDFAIVVKALSSTASPEQVAALARAKAAADALQAAAMQQAALLSGSSAGGAGAVLREAAAASRDVEHGLPGGLTSPPRVGGPAFVSPPPTQQQPQQQPRRRENGRQSLSSAAAAMGAVTRVLFRTASNLTGSTGQRSGSGSRKRGAGRRRSRGRSDEGDDSASSSDSDDMSDSSDSDGEEEDEEEERAAGGSGQRSGSKRSREAAQALAAHEEPAPPPSIHRMGSGSQQYGRHDDYDDSDEDESDVSDAEDHPSTAGSGLTPSASPGGVAAARRRRAAAHADPSRGALRSAAAKARRVTFGALPAAGSPAAQLAGGTASPARPSRSEDPCDGSTAIAISSPSDEAADASAAAATAALPIVAAKASTCAEILHALRSAGLQAKRVRSLSRRTWLIKLRAPEWRLELEAEKVKLRLRRVDGGWSKFRRSARHLFAPIEAAALEAEGGGGYTLFHSSDRQTLIHHILQCESREGGADLGAASPLGAYVTLMFPLHMQTRLEELRSDWLALWRPQRSVPTADRIGWVDPEWYRDAQLVDIEELLVAQRTGATAQTSGSSDGGAAAPLLSAVPSAARAAGVSQGVWGYVSALCGLQAGAPPSASAGARQPAGRSALELAVAATGASKGSQLAPPPGSGRATVQDGGASIAVIPDAAGSESGGRPRKAGCCLVDAVFTLTWLAGRGWRSAGRFAAGLMTQPLDRIAAYFGEHVAFYFAWLEFYTRWLVLPALGGLFLFIAQLYHGSLDISYAPVFSLCMALWSLGFLEAWKRRNAELAQRWGVLAYEAEEVTRPQFQGAWKMDARTGEVLRVYPRWRRWGKYAVTAPIILLLIAGMLSLMMMVFSTRDHVLAQFERHRSALAGRASMAADIAAQLLDGYLTPEEAAERSLGMPSVPPAVDLSRSFSDAWAGGLGGFLAGEASAGLASWSAARAAAAGSTADSGSFDLSSAQSFFSPQRWQDKLGELQAYFADRGDWQWWLAMILPPVFFGLLMPFFEWAFAQVASRFNDWENHATESGARNHLIAKIFCFRFVASFISLFYYAFSPQHSLLQLAVQLATFLIVGQLYRQCLETCLPRAKGAFRDCRFRRRVRAAEDSGVTEGKRGRRLVRHATSQAWREARMPRYDTFNDYAELLIQFGYVTFFSWSFPLAPLCALVNNVIEMRSDAFKLCYTCQRPIASKAGGIGVWYNVLVFMALLAVLTNAAHLALTSRVFAGYFPSLSDSERMLVVFLVEHAVLGLRLLMPWAVPELPRPVRNRLVRDAVSAARLAAAARSGQLPLSGAKSSPVRAAGSAGV